MITSCKNCGSPVTFDPNSQQVVCHVCGSIQTITDAGTEGAYQEIVPQFQEPVAPSPDAAVTGGPVQEFMQYYVYSCSACGGEIVINGSEASTTCIYCGSPSVVFNRVAEGNRPDYIIPFAISKETVIEMLKGRFHGGSYVPDEFKNLNPDLVRGIYIPYWLVDAYHTESSIISGTTTSERTSKVLYFGRSARLQMNQVPVEASIMLSDESSKRLEPYDFSHIRPFDESYLLGFYSNMSDLTFGQLRTYIDQRASDAYKRKITADVTAYHTSIMHTRSTTLIDSNIKYLLVPVWFVTVMYEGKPHTILVNGDTGKIVCGLPYNKKRFKRNVIAIASAVGGAYALFHFLVANIGTGMASFFGEVPAETRGFMSAITGITSFIHSVPFLLVALVVFLIGLHKHQQLLRQIERTQSEDIFNFTKKRQG